jgi:hypothetical protein
MLTDDHTPYDIPILWVVSIVHLLGRVDGLPSTGNAFEQSFMK